MVMEMWSDSVCLFYSLDKKTWRPPGEGPDDAIKRRLWWCAQRVGKRNVKLSGIEQ